MRDRLTNAIRALIERVLPWYDSAEVSRRRSQTRVIHQRSIAARLQVEDIARRYERFDGVLRR